LSIPLHVLIIEDNERDAALVLRELRRGGYNPLHERVDTEDAMKAAMARRAWDIVLSDFSMPRFSAQAALAVLAEANLDIPFIIVSGSIGEETAVEAMRSGAQDYVLKDNLKRLLPTITRELSAARTRREKKKADEKSDYERRLLQQLMSGTPDAISFRDLERRYIHLNDGVCKVLNVVCAEEALGKTAEAFVSPERARLRREEDEKVLTTGEPLIDCIEEIVGMDGVVRWFSATKVPIRGPRGEILGLVEVARDITESKRQEQMKNEFIATVSHELRTPLTAIMASVGFLAGNSGDTLPDSVMRLLRIAQGNCKRLVHIVNDILDIEKVESGGMACDQRPIEIRALVAQAIEANQSVANDYGLTVRLDDAAAEGFVNADPDRLIQVITNLLSNAIKFSAPQTEVTVMIENTDEAVRVSVRDHGPGIPDAYKDRIFDKFVQVDATDRRKKGGTGLGLSIARQIVRQFGGEIGFEAAPGGGTIFSVVLRRLRWGAEHSPHLDASLQSAFGQSA
jgi:two-component system sensor histidine kinase VicK